MKPSSGRYGKSVVMVFSLLGLLLSIYLAYIYSRSASGLYCAPGSSCDAVRESPYSSFAGVPVPVWGVAGYAALLLLSVAPFSNVKKWFLLYLTSLVALSFSIYLTYLELFVIKAVCPLCVASLAFITVIFGAVLAARPKASLLAPSHLGLLSAVVLITVGFGSHFVQSESLNSPMASTPEAQLAKHLTSIGATMYGTYWCPHCSAQKKLFGDAFRYINYVDCDPKAPKNANASLCMKKGVKVYPTWEINGRRYIGVKSLEELSYLSGFNSLSSH
ncbi:MAG: vitamin K epoxide reductase family protein [Candidatus Methanosuratincola sp.]